MITDKAAGDPFGDPDYEVSLTQFDEQRPFNTGTTEAKQIRDRSRPLFTIEMAVIVLSRLPNPFTACITAFATGFDTDYTVLGAVDDGISVDAIRQPVLANVWALSDGQENAVDDAIGRLVETQILERDGKTVRIGEKALRRWLLVPAPRGGRGVTASLSRVDR